MVEFVLSLADALHLRFTISPLCETIRLARSIANPTCIEGPRRVWLRRRRQSVEGLLRDPELRSFFALLSAPRHYHPDFLTAGPSSPIGEIEAELAQVRATPSGRVEQEIARCLEHARTVDPASERRLRSRGAADQLAGQLEALCPSLTPARSSSRDVSAVPAGSFSRCPTHITQVGGHCDGDGFADPVGFANSAENTESAVLQGDRICEPCAVSNELERRPER